MRRIVIVSKRWSGTDKEGLVHFVHVGGMEHHAACATFGHLVETGPRRPVTCFRCLGSEMRVET